MPSLDQDGIGAEDCDCPRCGSLVLATDEECGNCGKLRSGRKTLKVWRLVSVTAQAEPPVASIRSAPPPPEASPGEGPPDRQEVEVARPPRRRLGKWCLRRHAAEEEEECPKCSALVLRTDAACPGCALRRPGATGGGRRGVIRDAAPGRAGGPPGRAPAPKGRRRPAPLRIRAGAQKEEWVADRSTWHGGTLVPPPWWGKPIPVVKVKRPQPTPAELAERRSTFGGCWRRRCDEREGAVAAAGGGGAGGERSSPTNVAGLTASAPPVASRGSRGAAYAAGAQCSPTGSPAGTGTGGDDRARSAPDRGSPHHPGSAQHSSRDPGVAGAGGGAQHAAAHGPDASRGGRAEE